MLVQCCCFINEIKTLFSKNREKSGLLSLVCHFVVISIKLLFKLPVQHIKLPGFSMSSSYVVTGFVLFWFFLCGEGRSKEGLVIPNYAQGFLLTLPEVIQESLLTVH